MMKRTIALLLAALLAFSCAALAEDDWALTEARGFAQTLWKLCNDPNYVETIMGMSEVQTLAEEMAGADFSEPSAVWRVAIPGTQEIYDMLQNAKAVDGDIETLTAMSDLGFRELVHRLPASAVSAALGMAFSGEGDYTAWVVLSSVLSTGRGYVEPEGFEPYILLLDYPGRFAVAVTFTRIGEGVVSATAQAVPSGMMARVQGMLDELESAGIHLDIRRIIQE